MESILRKHSKLADAIQAHVASECWLTVGAARKLYGPGVDAVLLAMVENKVLCPHFSSYPEAIDPNPWVGCWGHRAVAFSKWPKGVRS